MSVQTGLGFKLNSKTLYHDDIQICSRVFLLLIFVFRKKQDPKPVVVGVQDQALPSTSQVSVDQCRLLIPEDLCILLCTIPKPNFCLKRTP